MITTTDPLTGTTINTYDVVGNLIQTQNAKSQISNYSYDPVGRLLTATDALSGTMAYLYDAVGNRLAITDPEGRTTHVEYDALNRPIAVTDALTQTASITYDEAGNRLTLTDANDQISRFAYDALNRLTHTTDPTGAVTHYEYDRLGNQTVITDPLGQTTHFTYDELYRLVVATDPLNQTARFAYDRVGNRILTTDTLQIATHYEYDALNQLIAVVENYQPGQPATADTNVRTTYAYDQVGNRVVVTDANTHAAYYAYDALNRLVQTTDALGRAYHFAYDPVGNLIGRQDANGVATNYSYDDLNRLIGIVYPEETVSLVYDRVGNRTTMTDSLGTTRYQYDPLYRLESVVDPYSQAITYTYDAIGNRTGLIYPGGAQTAYGYDAAGRPITVTDGSAGATTYQYDAAGRPLTATLPNGIQTIYRYDAAGRLIELTHLRGASVVARYEYELDALGNRLAVTETLMQPSGPASVVVTVHDTDGVLQVGLPVYAFSGSMYLGYHGTTDAAGQVTLTLPSNNYRFRADKNGTQFWSTTTNSCAVPLCTNAAITVSVPTIITVVDTDGAPQAGLPVYAFNGTTYTGYHATTDAAGQALLTLPLGSYRFRADKNGTQFWSGTDNQCAIPGCTAASITVSVPTVVRVTDTDGTPQNGLPVYAFNAATYTGYNGTTNASGQVTLTLPLGPSGYRFRADKNGTQFWSGSTNHCTIPGCTTTAITVSVPVVVTVLDDTSSPQVGLPVYAFDGTTYTGYNKTTDVSGQVTLTLPLGNYRFRADKNGTQFWSGSTNHCVVPGCLAATITTSIPTLITVLDPNGAPEVGLPVYAFNGTTYTGYNGTTDAAGQVTLTLPANSYRFRADKNGTQFWSGPDNHCTVPGCSGATVTTSLLTVVTVHNSDGLPETGLPVYAFDGTTYTGYTGATDATGQVTFTLPAGNYRFRADKNGTQFWSGATNHCAVPGCAVVSITTSLQTVVTVQDTDGVLQVGLPVYAFNGTTYTGFNGATNASGQVTFTLPAGTYRFRTDKNGTQFWSSTTNHCAVPGCVAVSVTVAVPVVVTVQDTNGTPQAGLSVYGFSGTTYTGYNGKTNAVGQVTLTLPLGSYRFRADTFGGTQFWSGTADHCALPGCTTVSVTVSIPTVINVLDTNGTPQAGLPVYAFDGTTYTGYNKTTDAAGQVTLTLPLGNYRFRADKNGTQFWSSSVNHCLIPGCTVVTTTVSIPVIVTVLNTDGVPQAGLPVYAFDGTTYTGYNKTTDVAGQVTLTLPVSPSGYRFRADKNGTQFWSDTGSAGNHCFIPGCTSASIVVAVPVVVTVQGSTGVPQANVSVYAFDSTTYTGYNGRTNASGQVTLTLPLGPFGYRFRADQAGVQYWSNPTNHCVVPGCTATTITLSTSGAGATMPAADASASSDGTKVPGGGVPPTSRPILVDPTILLLAPLAVLVMTGKRRKRSGLAWAATGLLLIAALVGVGLIVADGVNPPTVLAAPAAQSGGVTTTTVIRYTYDALHRLTQANYSTGERLHLLVRSCWQPRQREQPCRCQDLYV